MKMQLNFGHGVIFILIALSLSHMMIPTTNCMDMTAASRDKQRAYGEKCWKTWDCDVESMLDCIGGRCACMIWAEYSIGIAGLTVKTFMYEHSTGRCVSRLGQMCKFSVKDTNGTSFLYEETNCVENANCEPDGICRCHGKFAGQPADGSCKLVE